VSATDGIVGASDLVVLDLRDVGSKNRGVSRALREIGVRLLNQSPERYRAVCCAEGIPLLDGIEQTRLTVVPAHSQAVFEQVTLPAVATKLGARVVYSHRECGALWGPQLLLHVPEDPEVRWRRQPLRLRGPKPAVAREAARRCYSRMLMNAALRRARVVTSTRSTALDLERRHQLPADHVTVVPLGTDLDQFRPSANGRSGKVPYFFHLSSDDPREGTHVVIDAFAELVARTTEPVRLVVAGELGDTRGPLLERVANLGIREKVDTPGRVTDEHLVELYSGAAATVLASTNEGFGLQALEAMACGSLLVAAPAPATKEVAADADVEWTPVQAGPMAAALEAIVRDPARQQRASNNNRAVASRFSWDATAQRLDGLLRDMTAGRAQCKRFG
jgi:glycosyltransferase involved in cell wall biosynthesis